jgi:TonB family protein
VIAISYRRQDSLPVAGRLYDKLQGEFGKGNVFMDFDSIPYGVDFRQHIREMLDHSKVLVALIGPDWFGRGKKRTRRIDDPSDFIRLEIAYAFERKIPVIPVLLGNTKMPTTEELPTDIQDLAFRNAITLDLGLDFHHHADRLVGGINRLLIESSRATTPNVPLDVPVIRPQQSTPPSADPPITKPAEPRSTLFQESELLRSEPTPKTAHPAKFPRGQAEGASEARLILQKMVETGGAGTQTKISARRPFDVGTRKNRVRLFVSIIVMFIAGLAFYLFMRAVNTPDVADSSALPPPNASTGQKPVGSLSTSKSDEHVTTPPPQATASGLAASATPDEKKLARSKFEEAKRAFEEGHFATAWAFVTDADSTDPDEPYILNLRGQILLKYRQVDNAEAAFRKALKIDPQFKEAQSNLDALLKSKSSNEAATPTPSSQTQPRLSATEVQDFVRQFISANQAEEVEMALSTYATDVRYFDEGKRDRDYIRNDLEKYFQRWPIRQGSIQGDIAVKENVAGQEYTASFKQDFYAENAAGEWSRGEVAIQMDVMATWDGPKIFGINQQMLQRKKGKNAVHAPQLKTNEPQLLQAPRPAYPREAEEHGQVGSGRFSIEFDEQGNATAVAIVQSTGSKILDANTVTTLKRWHAVTGHAGKIVVPITYTKPNKPTTKLKQSATKPKQPGRPSSPPPIQYIPQYLPR